MFRFAFGKLGGLFEFQAAFFAVAPKQPETSSACVAKKASALSTDTVNAANSLKTGYGSPAASSSSRGIESDGHLAKTTAGAPW